MEQQWNAHYQFLLYNLALIIIHHAIKCSLKVSSRYNTAYDYFYATNFIKNNVASYNSGLQCPTIKHKTASAICNRSNEYYLSMLITNRRKSRMQNGWNYLTPKEVSMDSTIKPPYKFLASCFQPCKDKSKKKIKRENNSGADSSFIGEKQN